MQLKHLIIDILLCLGLASTAMAAPVAPPYYNWRYQTATTCSALTGASFADLCRQTSDNSLWNWTPGSSSWVQVGGGGSSNTFSNSIVNNGGVVTLVNDSTSPGNSMCYGTNGSGTKGWYTCSSGGTPAGNTNDIQINNSGAFGSLDGVMQGLVATTSSPAGLGTSLPIAINQTVTSPGTTTHAVYKLSNQLWGGTLDGKIYVMTTPDSNLATMTTVYTNGADAFYEVAYASSTGHLYFISANNRIVDVDPVAKTASLYSITSGSLVTSTAPSIASDGTYLYVVSYSSPSVFYKINISTGAITNTATWTGINGGHMIRYDSVTGYLYATSATGYLARVATSNLAYTQYNLSGGTFTDDSAILNGYLWLGSENISQLQKVNLSNMTAVIVTGQSSYGVFTDGTNIYNMTTNGYIDVYPAGGSTPYSFYDGLGTSLNELWITNAGRFITPVYSSSSIYWVSLGSITNLGIGTTSPAYNFDLLGSARILGSLYVKSLTNGSVPFVNSSGQIVTDANTNFTYSQTTGLNIGTVNLTSPGLLDNEQVGNEVKIGDYQGLLSGTYLDINDNNGLFTFNAGSLYIPANNIQTDTTTGMQIATATNQKIGFYGATPVVRQGATTDLGTVLSNLGLRTSGTAYPITTSGAVNLSGSNTINGYQASLAGSVSGTANQVTVGANSNSVASNFTISLPAAITLPGTLTLGGNITTSAYNIITDTTTGTKIGTATNQKLGFYNAAPIVQPTGNICTAMTNLGLVASCTESGVSMTWPSGGAGIPNYSGSSSWGTSYTTSGSGTVVALATSPVFITPTLGVASATTLNKITVTTPATGSTLTISDGKTLTVTNTVNLNTMTDTDLCTYTSSGTALNCTTAPSTFLKSANNLSDVPNTVTAQSNLFGVYVSNMSPTYWNTGNGIISDTSVTTDGSGDWTFATVILRGASSGTTTLNTPGNAGGSATFPSNNGYVGELNFTQTWSAAQTFNNSDIILKGSSTGTTTFTSGNSSASNYTLTFPAITDSVATLTSVQTLNNTRITKRVQTASDATSISVNSDSYDETKQSNSQATGTLTINNPTGTPTDGQGLVYYIKATGGVQTFSWGANFSGGFLGLPVSQPADGFFYYYYYKYSTTLSKWTFQGITGGY